MRRAIYQMLSSTPSKVAGIVSLGLTAWSAGNPTNFQQWWGWAMTAEHIRLAGMAGLFITVLYWLLHWWLKPKDELAPALNRMAIASAPNAVAVAGDVNAPIGDTHNHYYEPPPFKLTDSLVQTAVDRMHKVASEHLILKTVGDYAMGSMFNEALKTKGVVAGQWQHHTEGSGLAPGRSKPLAFSETTIIFDPT